MRITKVAIRVNGQVYSAEAPNRHHNLIHKYGRAFRKDQGFINPYTGEFMSRVEAASFALRFRQVKKENMLCFPELYSEDLW